MVAGLKQGDRVKAIAIKVLGAKKAENLFPATFKTQILHGVVLRKGTGRQMVVTWDDIDTTHSVSSRLLDNEIVASATSASETATSTTVAPPAASTAAASETEEIAAATEEMEDEDDHSLIEQPAFDAKEAEAAAVEPGDNLLRPHNCLWHKAPGGITVDMSDRCQLAPRIKWKDGLGNDRSPMQYFMHFHPDHLGAAGTLHATNQNLEDNNLRPMTRQEFYVYVGITFVLAFYPKFSTTALFSQTASVRRSRFILLPDVSQYMSFARFKALTRYMAFISPAQHDITGNDDAFWQVQPLIDAFNYNRRENFSPGSKLVVDESMSEWKGKDQRFGKDGCPHVTKIIRKPKGVGMELKNLADCDTGILMALEIMGPKTEMRHRMHTGQYGAGTALLLRLCRNLRGTGRVIVADSAFASVKSAIALKKELGLYFLGIVKTAHKMFPKQYLQNVEIAERGGFVALTTKVLDVDLRAVTWNDGKKDKSTGDIIRKNIIASCGTTLPGVGHRKRRWTVDQEGRAHIYLKTIPRPELVEEFFEGAQQIDVHNHLRQGRAGIALERRPAQHWRHRFHQTYLGMIEVDSYLAYRYFCPGKRAIKHNEFLRVLTQQLLDNKIGCAPDAPVLRPRHDKSTGGSVSGSVHGLKLLRNAKYYKGKSAEAAALDNKPPQCVLKCRVCGKNSSYFCPQCSDDTCKTKGIFAICGPKTGRDCFERHQQLMEDLSPI